jgi:hypothetical protein
MAELSSVQMIPAASFDLTTLTGTFQPMNGTGFADDIKICKIYNGGSVGVDISLDGVTKHDFWPAGATLIVDFQTNHSDNSAYGAGTLNGRKGQIIWGRTSTTSTQLQIAGFR